MILTDRFVFMHIPKTGGTFVSRVLRELLTPHRWDWRMHAVGRRYGVYLPLYPYKYRELDQHAMRKHIPASHASLPILSCVRNPFDIYVSEYTFDWWRENPAGWFDDVTAVEREYGRLEELDFPRFVRATVDHSRWSQTARQHYPQFPAMAYCSTEWLHYHCLEPASVVADSRTIGDLLPRVRASIAPIHFLQTHRLNQDLHAFLQTMDFPAAQIDPILARGKIHPGKPRRKEGDHWSRYYDDKLRQLVRERESLLFELFPEFDESPAPAE